jgi:diguanylate cyclase (GGDEF)-like protein
MTSSEPKLPRVLLVDDSEHIHALLRKRLERMDIELHSAVNGEEGLKMARELKPALILLDLKMPGADGFQALRAIKDDADLNGVQVIIISASEEIEDKVTGLELGAVDYVCKPFIMPELRARMNSALRIHQLMTLLAQRAQVDGLTGLWNRAHFDSRLAEEVSHRDRAGGPLTLVLCDADHFKSVNDTYGHAAGDAVLKGVAETIHRMLRARDIPCRYGGEEFAILLRDTPADKAVPVVERLRQEIEKTRWPAHPERAVTMSFGLTDCPEGDAKSPVNWIKAADEALYQAKQQGRNRVCVGGASASRPPLAKAG